MTTCGQGAHTHALDLVEYMPLAAKEWPCCTGFGTLPFCWIRHLVLRVSHIAQRVVKCQQF